MSKVGASAQRLGQVQSLVRAFGILDELCKADGITLGDLAAATDLPRSTVHRLLTTLEALDYAGYDSKSCKWFVGRGAFKVRAAFLQTRDLGRLGRNIMASLAVEVHHSANLSIPENHSMHYVSQIKAKGAWLTAARPGVRLPMHSTASGKAFMACWTEVELDDYLSEHPLMQNTSRTISNRDALRRELERIRECGFAVDDQEQSDGQRCVAAAIVDRIGRPRGAISVSDSSVRLRRPRLTELGSSLVSAARRISTDVAHVL